MVLLCSDQNIQGLSGSWLARTDDWQLIFYFNWTLWFTDKFWLYRHYYSDVSHWFYTQVKWLMSMKTHTRARTKVGQHSFILCNRTQNLIKCVQFYIWSDLMSATRTMQRSTACFFQHAERSVWEEDVLSCHTCYSVFWLWCRYSVFSPFSIVFTQKSRVKSSVWSSFVIVL